MGQTGQKVDRLRVAGDFVTVEDGLLVRAGEVFQFEPYFI